MQIIFRGAEAIIYKKGNKVIKERIKKGYRIRQIDLKIRKERTRREARLLEKSREIGVLTPRVLRIDEKNCKIEMEFIEGVKLKDYLDKAPKEKLAKLGMKIGKIVGKLHSYDIIHGDLTTSNFILSNEKLFLIDFGLGFVSKRIENKGTDLHLLLEALRSTHPKIAREFWEYIIKGYKSVYKNAKDVIERLKEIEKRGRYVKR